MVGIEIFAQIFEIILRVVVAVLMAVTTIRFSKYLFGFELVEETKKGNIATGIVLFGLLFLIGLVVGLFKI